MSEQFADEPSEAEVVSSRTGFSGSVWDVREDAFRYGDAVLVRHYVEHPGAVAVVALDDERRVLLLQQYRHPVRMRDWEIPAGLRDVAGEDPVETAARELAEEVDLTAREWARLGEFALTPGGSDERIVVFLATGLASTDEPFPRHAEEADIRTMWVPLADAVAAIREGRVANATTAIGVLTAAERLRHDGDAPAG
ncbi:MAG: NUDIX domain-containing protein [Microbacterium sp.]